MNVVLWIVLAWVVLLVGFLLGWLTCIALHERQRGGYIDVYRRGSP